MTSTGNYNAYGSYIQLSTLDDKEKSGDIADGKPGFLETVKYRRFLCTKRDTIIVVITLVLAVCLIATTLAIGLPKIKEKEQKYLDTSFKASQSPLLSFNNAVVLTDGELCASIGKNILQKNGSAVDAAIAALFCNGVVTPQSMGLGGGFFMLLYFKKSGKSFVIDAREVAPMSATEDMFQSNKTASLYGGLAAAVPGELPGYNLAHKKYGKLPWSELIKPSIDICNNGFVVSRHLADKLKRTEERIINDSSMREEFFNNETGKLYSEGEVMKRPVLGKTLQTIADKGSDALYSGELTEQFVKDIEECGGIITKEDLQQYQPEERDSIITELKEDSSKRMLHTVPPPGGGLVLSLILQILQGYNFSADSMADVDTAVLNYHRLIEAFKFGFAYKSKLGDPSFVDFKKISEDLMSKEYIDSIRQKISDDQTYPPAYYEASSDESNDHGTAQVSVLAPNGDAVSVTSTVNTYFGCLCRLPSTGIILNNEMNEFTSANITSWFEEIPSPLNFIAPRKRPVSSMSPAILTDEKGDVQMVSGGMGGTRILTALAQNIMRILWLHEDAKQAADALRLHHQLLPNYVQYEKGFPKVYLDKLEKYGHEVREDKDGGEVLSIVRRNGAVETNVDYRKGGSADGF